MTDEHPSAPTADTEPRRAYIATNGHTSAAFMTRSEAEDWLASQGSGRITNSHGEVVYLLTKGGRELHLAGGSKRRSYMPPYAYETGGPMTPFVRFREEPLI